MENIYFIGINGIGMSGLAKIMKLKGYEVSGGDLSRNYVTEELESLGIKVYNEHRKENIEGANLIVASSAIKENNPELKEARAKGIKILKRGELLALLMNREKGIAFAGTHGKTTTSSMASSVLLDIDPTIVVGGILPEIKSNAKYGTSEIFIAEADESDNSFLHIFPEVAVVTNIEADHLENHGSLENIKRSFNQFLEQTKGEKIVCGDCEEVLSILANKEKVKTYGIKNPNNNIQAKNIRVENEKTIYEVIIDGKEIGTFKLSIPGKHNVLNSLPVIYLGLKYGIAVERIQEKLENFRGAKRRYDILYSGDIRIIDDYAHHPTEIKATIQGAKSIEKNRTVAIFEPHRYSRVNFLLEEFKGSFEGVDEVRLLPIYSAGEKNEFGITLELLRDKIGHKDCKILENNQEIEKEVMETKEPTTYLFMGAGSISKLANSIANNLRSTNENI